MMRVGKCSAEPHKLGATGAVPVPATVPLLDTSYIRSRLTKHAAYCDGHGAAAEFLGCGLIYFAIPYLLRARTCVCLGSGGGFVPRLMRQGQIEAMVTKPRTLLVDACDPELGHWGMPDYSSPRAFFRRHWPEIRWLRMTTAAARSRMPRQIDYLHIDADHSYEGVRADWRRYWPLVASHGIVTLHDWHLDGPNRLIKQLRRDCRLSVFVLDCAWGIAIVQRRVKTGPWFCGLAA